MGRRQKIQILDFEFQNKHLLSLEQVIISKVKTFDCKKKIISWSISIIYVVNNFPFLGCNLPSTFWEFVLIWFLFIALCIFKHIPLSSDLSINALKSFLRLHIIKILNYIFSIILVALFLVIKTLMHLNSFQCRDQKKSSIFFPNDYQLS